MYRQEVEGVHSLPLISIHSFLSHSRPLSNPATWLLVTSIATNSGPILLINVYMPTDLSDDASYDEYVDICTKIMSVFTD